MLASVTTWTTMKPCPVSEAAAISQPQLWIVGESWMFTNQLRRHNIQIIRQLWKVFKTPQTVTVSWITSFYLSVRMLMYISIISHYSCQWSETVAYSITLHVLQIIKQKLYILKGVKTMVTSLYSWWWQHKMMKWKQTETTSTLH